MRYTAFCVALFCITACAEHVTTFEQVRLKASAERVELNAQKTEKELSVLKQTNQQLEQLVQEQELRRY